MVVSLVILVYWTYNPSPPFPPHPSVPGIVLGDPVERCVGLQFFHPQKDIKALPETRLLAIQSDGLVRLWLLHVTEWITLTTFYLPFQRSVISLSYDYVSRRLMYIEEIREDHQAAPPERLRIVSREMNLTSESSDGEDGGDCEIITVGCAVSVMQVRTPFHSLWSTIRKRKKRKDG